MTNEKAAKDMKELIEKHDFKYEGERTYNGLPSYTRRWSKKTEVAWYGESEQTLEIKISMSYGVPLVRIYRKGRRAEKTSDDSSTKRAFNAIKEIVSFAGFEM